MTEFKNKIALVTGASRGIGRAVALCLAAEGAQVIITYRKNKEAAQAVLRNITERGGQGHTFQNDAGDFEAVKMLMEDIKKKVGVIDFLINNAGISLNKSFFMLTETDWDQVVRTNLKGVFNFCRHAIVDFLKRKTGIIVNVASVAGFKGLAGQANYCAAKAGIINLTRALAREVGRSGVRINAVAPGFINTDMTESMPPKVVANYLAQIPAQAFGDPQDVAEAVLFLLSSRSKYILGETLIVDGGLSL